MMVVALKLKQTRLIWSGAEINLSSNKMSIKSDHLNIDEDGKMKIISTTGTYKGAELQLVGSDMTNYLYSHAIAIKKGPDQDLGAAALEVIQGDGNLVLTSEDGDFVQLSATNGLRITNDIDVLFGNVTAQDFIKTSLAEKKKDFEKFDNALDIIKNTDIYKYHYKNQDDNTKKDIGLVIGDDYKYSQELTNNEDNAVNISNVAFVCMRAIQEQQEIIESLEARIKELEEGK